PVLGADLDAEAAELTLGADLEVAIRLLVEERRVRVESRQHPVDRFLEELAVLDRLHVIALDAPEDLAEKTQVVDRQLQRGDLAVRDGGEVEARRDAERRADGHQADLLELLLHPVSPLPQYPGPSMELVSIPWRLLGD